MTRLLHEKSPVTSLCIYRDISGIIKYSSHDQCNDDEITVAGILKNKPFTNGDINTAVKKEEWIMDADGEPLFEHDEIEEYLYVDEDQQGL